MNREALGLLAPGTVFWSAFGAFQSDCPNPPLDGFNGHFKSKYTLLQTLLQVTRDHLRKHKLSLSQLVEPSTGEHPAVIITTILAHESGEALVSSGAWPTGDGSPQKIAAVTTYARRVSASAILGKAGDDDDDGNAAQGNGQPAQKPTNGAQPAKRPEPQSSQAKARFKELSGLLDKDFGLPWKLAYTYASKALKITCGLTECTDAQLEQVCGYLEQLGATLTHAGKLGDDHELSKAAGVDDWKLLDLAGATALVAKMEGGAP